MPSKVRAISSVRPARASSDVPNSAPARPARKVTDGKKANSNRAGQVIQEGLAKVRVPDGIFFNPAMRLCRDLSSLWVGALPPVQNALDAFCASGIRGLRYKLENEDVGALTLLDASESAAQAAEDNIKLNKIEKENAKAVRSPVEVFLASHYGFDLVEIDPFGTPAPFLPFVLRSCANLKSFHLSITATDTAVLCGAHAPACLNQYNCKPLDNEFCHENAVRILLGHLARAASQFDFSLHPQLCFSDKHYVKLLVGMKKGAPGAVLSSKQAMKFVAHCPKCLWHSLGDFPPALCPLCGGRCDWAGPLWGGEWASKESVEKMMALLPQRPYLLQKEAGSFLGTIASEAGGPALYYDLHELASRHKRRIPSMEDLLGALQSAGLFASRTHFKAHSIRTNASLDEILQFMSKT
ncbi:MAG: hypothetical protein V1728_02815 [Candidatus Micrarchaeota archaeon]